MILSLHQAPSISSKGPGEEMEEENMDNNRMMFDWDQGFNQGYTQEQVDGKCSLK